MVGVYFLQISDSLTENVLKKGEEIILTRELYKQLDKPSTTCPPADNHSTARLTRPRCPMRLCFLSCNRFWTRCCCCCCCSESGFVSGSSGDGRRVAWAVSSDTDRIMHVVDNRYTVGEHEEVRQRGPSSTYGYLAHDRSIS